MRKRTRLATKGIVAITGLLSFAQVADAGWWRPRANRAVNLQAAASSNTGVSAQRGNPYASQYNPLWGPIRYNQWGQPQWPYSQRTKGVTQLGPIPAAAGVRSLPGWGGER